MKVNVFNLIILDENGSMGSIQDAAIAGLNKTIQATHVLYEINNYFSQELFNFATCLKICNPKIRKRGFTLFQQALN
jgi:hypothetical protein